MNFNLQIIEIDDFENMVFRNILSNRVTEEILDKEDIGWLLLVFQLPADMSEKMDSSFLLLSVVTATIDNIKLSPIFRIEPHALILEFGKQSLFHSMGSQPWNIAHEV